MKIPSETGEKFQFYVDIASKCRMSQGARSRQYKTWRNYYMYGSDGGPVGFNKIYPHIDTLTSYLYSQETTRFSTALGVSVSNLEFPKLGPINRGINDQWNNSNTDIVFGMALQWGLVYGTTLVKPRWKVNGVEPFVVDPHNFGVLREDSPMLSSQEAFTHNYFITQSQLANELAAGEHPRATQILNQVIAAKHQTVASVSPIDRIITSASSPNVIGNVDLNLPQNMRYIPAVNEPLVEMCELYIHDDEINDYRLVTLADPYVVVYDRPLSPMFLEHEAPFVQVCPIPCHDYFWGISEVERLITLQDMYSERLAGIRHMLAKQAKPPKNFAGFSGITDEIAHAFDTPDGFVQSDMPGAKVEPMDAGVSQDIWNDLDRIAQMFEDTSGINNVMQGKGESGVRSSGQTSQLARLGSSRVKKRAMIVEDSLEKLATLYLKLMQKYDKTRYKEEGDDGKQFIAEQFTKDFIVKVDGHSNSPIFVEDQTQIAFELVKVNAITKERLLELVTVPMRDQLVNDLKTKIEPAEQQAHQQEHEEKMAEIQAKAGRRIHAK